ncbi:MAG: RNA 2'-phosphotransferase, partial [Chthoniobacterales bacterium]|nr:RNA 2'-phosphotransferase [Chthoniobacterales bacterium]
MNERPFNEIDLLNIVLQDSKDRFEVCLYGDRFCGIRSQQGHSKDQIVDEIEIGWERLTLADCRAMERSSQMLNHGTSEER